MSDACDAAIAIQYDLTESFNKKLKVKTFTDSEPLLNFVIRNASTTGLILMINIKGTQESYNEGIINDFLWIRR